MAVLAIPNHPEETIIPLGAWQTDAVVTLDGSNCAGISFIPTYNPFANAMSFFEFRCYFNNIVGSAKCTAYIYSDSGLVPGAMVLNGASAESGVLSTNAWNTFTWSGTLPGLAVDGTRYFLVLKKTSGTSAQFRFEYGTGPTSMLSMIGSNASSTTNWRALVCTGVDGVWAGSSYAAAVGFRFGVKDAVTGDVAYFGNPTNNYNILNATNQRIDGSQEAGPKFTTSANVSKNIRTLIITLQRIGSPGALTAKIYEGDATSPSATGLAIAAGIVRTSSVNAYQFDFGTAFTLKPSTTYRITLSAASGSNAANYYYIGGLNWDSDATSLAMVPSAVQFCTLIAGVWADTNTTPPPFALILDTVSKFNALGGGFPILRGSVVR
jgi:hypothetical protein